MLTLTTPRKLQISAAVMLALAGCGGGGSSASEPLATTPGGNTLAGAITTPNAQTPAAPAPQAPATPAPQPQADTSSQQPATPTVPEQPAKPEQPAQPAPQQPGTSANTPAPATPAPVTPATPVAPTQHAAISAEGITGAVLATMLDQRSVEPGEQDSALAWPSTLDGQFLGASRLPSVQSVQFRSTPYAGEGERPGAPGSYSAAEGIYTYTAFNGTVRTDNPSTYAVNSIGMDLDINRTDDAVVLGTKLVALDVNGENYQNGPHYTSHGYKVGDNELIRYNEVLTEWENGAHSVQISIGRVADDQAALCWNFHLPNTSRLYCNKWKAPANWKAGQPLVHAGYYLVEDRNGEKLYWHTKPVTR